MANESNKNENGTVRGLREHSCVCADIIILVVCCMGSLRLAAACASIIANDLIIIIISLLWHERMTAVRRMREYSCEWHRYSDGQRLMA